MATLSLPKLSNSEVIAEVLRLAAAERKATAQLVAALAELDARRLYLGEGCASLFTYCTTVLHLSEHAAYSRIEAARVGRRFPVIFHLLISGDVTLTNVGLLARVLTEENHREVLIRATHKSKRRVEELVAELCPRPDVPTSVRRLPHIAGTETGARCASATWQSSPPTESPKTLIETQAAARSVIAPLAPERYKVQFTVNRETCERLRRVQDLMRHSVPDGDLAAVFDRALCVLLIELEKSKMASTSRPRTAPRSVPRSRHIPASVRREVWRRDEGRCTFRGTRGRCAETGFLEFHHVRPFAVGGKADSRNIELRCRAHNQYEAELFFGVRQDLIVRETSAGDFVETRSGPSSRCSGRLIPHRGAAFRCPGQSADHRYSCRLYLPSTVDLLEDKKPTVTTKIPAGITSRHESVSIRRIPWQRERG